MNKSIQTKTDKSAIAISILCVAHCLLLPVLLSLTPSLAILNLDSEVFHIGLAAIVIPISLYALTLGCKQHQRFDLLLLGSFGLGLLLTAVFAEETVGEHGEKALTILGSILIATSHLINFRRCQAEKAPACECEGK